MSEVFRPKLSGFTIIRNGVEYDFPFLESFQSALPIVDEFVINLGISTDDTKNKISEWVKNLPEKDAQKIVVFESNWPLDDPEQRKGGRILSDQTNLALSRCKGDWCLYLQADEVLHEEDYALFSRDLARAHSRGEIDALVFRYVHFYGDYGVVQTSRSSYRREIRAVRNFKGIASTGDAQSFRNRDGSKIGALLTQAQIFHYGWVRHQEIMKVKTGFMDTLYHPNASKEAPETGDNYVYKRIVGLAKFTGSHPKTMVQRVEKAPKFDFKSAPKAFQFKDFWKVLSGVIERTTGYRPFEYKNYKLVR